MINVSNFFYVDGIDLWANYSFLIEKGSADLLRYPPKKPSTERDWLDADGVDVDLSRIFFGKREVALKCAIIVDSEVEFFAKRNAFIVMLTQPGLRRLSITSHGARSYRVFYKDCTGIEKIQGVKGIPGPHTVAYYFTLVIVEPEPKLDASDIPLVDDARICILT